MNREDLIQKWLDHNLTSTELEAFKKLEDYDALMKLSQGLEGFEAPKYNTNEQGSLLFAELSQKKSSSKYGFIKPILKVAAILLISFGLYYYTISLDTQIHTEIAQTTTVSLPGSSELMLNAGSQLTYNKNNWLEKRELTLKGEAFFKVVEGEKFTVNTSLGKVEVLGTEFNVKQRNNILEVICYEGLVAVSLNNNVEKLYPGDTFLLVNGKQIVIEKETSQQPSWITGESTFKSIPLKEVFNELERQYGVTIIANKKLVDTSVLFTGRFAHNNIDIALKSITLPLHLSYRKKDNQIVLARD